MITQYHKRMLIAGMFALTLAAGITSPASATTSYTMTIVKLECIIKQDSVFNGKDEPRVEVNAMPVYTGSGFSNGTIKYVPNNGTTVYSSATISIWELDASPDPDDYIGYFTITSANVVGMGELTHILGGSSGKYKVTYRVD